MGTSLSVIREGPGLCQHLGQIQVGRLHMFFLDLAKFLQACRFPSMFSFTPTHENVRGVRPGIEARFRVIFYIITLPKGGALILLENPVKFVPSKIDLILLLAQLFPQLGNYCPLSVSLCYLYVRAILSTPGYFSSLAGCWCPERFLGVSSWCLVFLHVGIPVIYIQAGCVLEFLLLKDTH